MTEPVPPGWSRDGATLTKEFVFNGFTEATQFIAHLAPVANALDHHPDIHLYGYKRVKLTLTTHRTGGLTGLDYELARQIDGLR